jgi:HSP20 family protein
MDDMNKSMHWSDYARTYLGDQFWNEIMGSLQPYNKGVPFPSHLTGNTTRSSGPRLDLFRTTNDLVALVEIPGVDNANSIDLHIDGQSLSISGYIRKKYPEDAAVLLERVTGHFERTVSLPVAVRKEGVIAKYANGVLEIRMPIAGQDKSRKHKVKIDY